MKYFCQEVSFWFITSFLNGKKAEMGEREG